MDKLLEDVKEYMRLKESLLKKVEDMKKQIYKYDILNLGETDGWYELCDVEVEVYDALRFVYEDQDKDEEETVIISVEKFFERVK